MKKIPEGYKETELGVIPQEWEVRKVNENFQLYSGNSLSRAQLIGNEYFCVHYGDIHTSNKTYFCVEEDKDWLPKVDISKIKEGTLLETGDVVFADASEDYEGVGKSIVIFNDNKKILAGLHTIVAKSKKNVLETHFKKYFMNSEIVRKQFKKLATGSKVYGISKTNLGLIKFIYPPLPEQQKIAEILSSVDDHIEKLDETISEYELLKKGLMKKLLTEGIGHTEFKDTEIGRIPKEWEVRKLGDCVDFYNGKAHENEVDFDGKYILVNSKFISTEGRVKKYTNLELFPLRINDITMVMSDVPNGKAIAKTFLIDEDDKYTLNQRICCLRVLKDIEPRFLNNVVNRNKYYLRFDDGAKQTNLRKNEVLDLLVQLPPLKEQKLISDILDNVNYRINLYKSEKEDFMQVKKGLMEKLLIGKIRV